MLNIVCLGGGTGLYTLLRGLKNYPCQITAIVTMTDDGGSTGRLRDEYGILPPGDVRRCLVALSESTELMKKIFEYRFERGSLKNHSLGNIIMTALSEIEESDTKGIKKACELLKIKGKVLPCTKDHIHLCAELENGNIIYGETNIDIPQHNPNLKIKTVFLDESAEVLEESKKAILESDIITIGPGDLYTSLIPNLLVKGIPEAIINSKAALIYICNLMTKHGETDNFTVNKFVSEIKKYVGKDPEYVLYNTTQIRNEEILFNYQKEKATPVKLEEELKNSKLIGREFIQTPGILRHDSDKLAQTIIKLGIMETLDETTNETKND